MYKLSRIGDGAGCTGHLSEAVEYCGWPNNNRLVSDRPTIGCGMVVLRNLNTYWQTTLVTEILEDTPTYVRFKTKNSEYEWRIIE